MTLRNQDWCCLPNEAEGKVGQHADVETKRGAQVWVLRTSNVVAFRLGVESVHRGRYQYIDTQPSLISVDHHDADGHRCSDRDTRTARITRARRS
ncbi:MAG: hypothetical protein IT353_22790 [Gemmatimonadaceae bacterium]|nr:hypothetical protein [Gemmatimonadaceae bacterium]